MKKVVVIAVFVALSMILSCQKETPTEVKEGENVAMDEGARIFKEKCSGCHGPEGKGDIGPDLTDSEWRYGGTDEDLLETISNGRPGGMPSWKSELSEDKIRKVIRHIRGLSKKE
jgi:cytochrome c oxidase cbb3-type subunit 3